MIIINLIFLMSFIIFGFYDVYLFIEWTLVSTVMSILFLEISGWLCEILFTNA